ncbi:MAG: hypothetical protein IPN95_05270 [Bacteroidetes bacterium]|nr:hypothetical protein [Bacteroidota bacterium]MBP6721428.1 hypothetical protein [Bacteroidia bacterium]MBP8073348.1 hypothetical protein [Bacteroidia bacterium]
MQQLGGFTASPSDYKSACHFLPPYLQLAPSTISDEIQPMRWNPKSVVVLPLFVLLAGLAYGQSYVLFKSDVGCTDSIPLSDVFMRLQVDTLDKEIGWLEWEVAGHVPCENWQPEAEIRNVSIRNDGFPIYLIQGTLYFKCKCGFARDEIFSFPDGSDSTSRLNHIQSIGSTQRRLSQIRVWAKYFDAETKTVVDGPLDVRVEAVIDPKDVDALILDRMW